MLSCVYLSLIVPVLDWGYLLRPVLAATHFTEYIQHGSSSFRINIWRLSRNYDRQVFV